MEKEINVEKIMRMVENNEISAQEAYRVLKDLEGTIPLYKDELLKDLSKGVSTLLKMEEDEIDTSKNLMEMGADSVIITAFSRFLKEKYNIDIVPSIFFEYPNLDSFTEYLRLTFYHEIDSFYGANAEINLEPISINQSADTEGIVYKQLINELVESVASLLKMEITEVDTNKSFNEFGFDSVTFTAFSRFINSKYEIDVTPAVFYENTNLNSLAGFLFQENKVKLISLLENKDQVENITIHKEDETIKTPVSRFTEQEDYEKDFSIENRLLSNEPVAIIGMSGIMPQSDTLEEFWKNLLEGKDLISEIPEERWNWKDYYGDPQTEVNKTNIKWGGFVNHLDKFDAGFFGISPREAELMDPQQRIFLQIVWKTIEDAGYRVSDLTASKTGLFVGATNSGYSELLEKNKVEVQAYTSTGNTLSILSNRISYILDWCGPSMTVDTACSSSLVAIHLAMEAIMKGDCEIAVAGGVSTILVPEIYISFNKAGMLSLDGRCKTFDKRANGYVRGEGAGAILLKPLSKALKDGDNIYAVIRSSSVNHGGRANSLTAPNPNAQAELILSAWRKTGIDPKTITYIEAHGTGTNLGDPVEINGLKKAFKELYGDYGYGTPEKVQCGVGSVKSNIGHLETAAGIAGLFKVVLGMKNNKIPANMNFEELNPYIRLEESPFYIVNKTVEWDTPKDEAGQPLPKRAGVSSFGFGGANAHVVLEEYKAPSRHNNRITGQSIFVLSARNEERLKEYAKKMISFFNGDSIAPLINIEELTLTNNLNIDIKKIISDVLNVSIDMIHDNEELEDYGFEAIKYLELKNKIGLQYGIELDVEIFKEFNTVNSLSVFLLKNNKANIIRFYQGQLPQIVQKFDNKNYDGFDIEGIAYTLQVGREPMEERLAILASSIKEWVEKLECYYSGNLKTEGIFKGNSKRGKNDIQFLNQGRAGKEFIRVAIEDRDYELVAKLWVAGVDIDWKSLYQANIPKRIPLPTYPFAMDSYWFQKSGEKALKDNTGKASLLHENFMLHPIISANQSTFFDVKYYTLLSGQEPFIRDHVIHEKRILPGVAYVEMVRAAGENALQTKIRSMKNIVWQRPVVVEQEPVGIDTILSMDEADESIIHYEVRNSNKNMVGSHSQGQLDISETGDFIYPTYEDIESIKRRCPQIITHEECYEMFCTLGNTYGDFYKVIKEIYYSDTECVSVVEIPEEFNDEFENFLLHPGIMDGAVQSIIGMTAGMKFQKKDLSIPFSLSELEIYHPVTKKGFVHVTRNMEDGMNTNQFDLSIIDENGSVAVLMKKLMIRKHQPSENIKVRNKEDEILMKLIQEISEGKIDEEDLAEFVGVYEIEK